LRGIEVLSWTMIATTVTTIEVISIICTTIGWIVIFFTPIFVALKQSDPPEKGDHKKI
jgi:hypothetical protein